MWVSDMINTHLSGDFAWLNNRPIYASISGGKDSTAMGLYLKDLGIKFTPMFLDTGWEHPDTVQYIRDVLTPEFGDFVVLRNEEYFTGQYEGWRPGMEEGIYRNKMFPSGRIRWCSAELKVKPAMAFMTRMRVEHRAKPVNCVGIRAQESNKRAQLASIEEFDEATTWRPIMHFKVEDVVEIHKKYAVAPNPLYLRGAERVGCYPCIYSNKSYIRYLSYTDPAILSRLSELERRMTEYRDSLDKEYVNYGYFVTRRPDKVPMSVAETIEWSRSDHNGVYVDDIAELEEQGCMRWGLCESVGIEPTKSKKAVQNSLF